MLDIKLAWPVTARGTEPVDRSGTVAGRLDTVRRVCAVLMLGAAACSARADDPSSTGPVTRKTVDLPAGEFHEECLDLSRPQRLHYAFSSAQPVAFNIHYHRGKDIVYPVRLKNIRSWKSVFSPPRNEGYCMMWSNSQRNGVKIEYQFSIRATAAPQ